MTEHVTKSQQQYIQHNEEAHSSIVSKIREIINHYSSKYPIIDMLSSSDKHEDIWKFKNTNDNNEAIEDEFSDWDADSNDDESENEKSVSIDISSKTIKEIQDIMSLLEK